MKTRKFAMPVLILALAGCSNNKGQINIDGGIGIVAIRSACPQVGVPAGTGDITLFNPPASRVSSAIDMVASITNVHSTCDEDSGGADIHTHITFDVEARRTHAEAARDLVLPYFVTVVQGGSMVVAKRIGQVTLHFDAGQIRAQGSGDGYAIVSRSEATLPPEVRAALTRKRKPGTEDAAIDPLTTPQVRTAVARATFEALVGFQLTNDQLQYNVTR